MKDVLDLDLQLYLRSLLPQEDALLQEMRSFAEEHYVSIVDPEVGYLLHLLTGLVQPQTIYSGSNNSRTITANAIVFLFAQISDPLPQITPDWIGNHLTFENRDYTITNIVDNREPYSNKVYSYELEVL